MMPCATCCFAVAAIILTTSVEAGTVHEEHHKYCIVGAGPAGVQLGHFMWSAPGGRDYIILEQHPRAASFFSKYPIHRTLNSINRRHTRSGNLEFNLRHDWNSLLGGEETAGLFTKWSKEYWPPADTLVEYINAFAAPQVQSGHLQFCQEVTQVSQCKKSSTPTCAYKLSVRRACAPALDPNATCLAKKSAGDDDAARCSSSDGRAQKRKISCEALIMANGMWKPRIVEDWIRDLQEHSVRYDELTGIDAEAFENKSVLILGHGNAAVETADNIRNYARDIVVVSRSSHRFLQGTRYVGDVRARRTTHIDANSFKSYEGVTQLDLNASWLVATACGPDEVNDGFQGKPPVCIFTTMYDNVVTLAPVMPAYQGLIDEAQRLFGDKVAIRNPDIHGVEHANSGNKMFRTINYPAQRILTMHVDSLRANLTAEQRRLLAKLRDTTKYSTAAGMEFQKPFDIVITSLGWTYNRSLFDKTVKISMVGPPQREDTDSAVYPSLTGEFESTSAPNLFIAGAAAHGRDRYRYKASGGFIHGFRFNCRALWRILQARYEGAPEKARSQPPLTADGASAFKWGHKETERKPKSKHFGINVTAATEKSALWGHMIHRMNNAAGPYEQVAGALADGIVYDCLNNTVWYMEDLPEDVVHDRYIEYPRITWSYYYGSNTYLRETALLCQLRSPRLAILGSFVHPVIQYYPPGVRAPFPHERPWSEDMGMSMHLRTGEHPSIFWEHIEGVKRVHLMDQFVWGDWNDPETLGVLQPFMAEVEKAVGKFCRGKGHGEISRGFDEVADVRMWIGPEFKEELKINAGKCDYEGL
mmetsp:Transcript_16004/g.28526  ORF Transcript_16004/g.28526 Transcript_16004/m.28526 type:complete len:815 (+) Transcript_16004:101-2545(+)